MSKLTVSAFLVGLTVAATWMPISAFATDLAVAPAREVAPACGRCGCLRVAFDHHREMLMTYGTGFDPRNFDTTEPFYYFGRVRAYPHFWLECESGQSPAE